MPLTITATKVVFNQRQVHAWATKRAKDALQSATAYLYTCIRNSIRTTKRKPSAPGKPPHTREGALKHAIRFKISPDGLSSDIGILNNSMGNLPAIAALHEFGGIGPIGKSAQRIFSVGHPGPIALRKKPISMRNGKKLSPLAQHAVFAFIRTPSQAARANAIARSLQEKTGQFVGEHRYPQRSFLAANLKKFAPQVFAKFGLK